MSEFAQDCKKIFRQLTTELNDYFYQPKFEQFRFWFTDYRAEAPLHWWERFGIRCDETIAGKERSVFFLNYHYPANHLSIHHAGTTYYFEFSNPKLFEELCDKLTNILNIVRMNAS